MNEYENEENGECENESILRLTYKINAISNRAGDNTKKKLIEIQQKMIISQIRLIKESPKPANSLHAR